MNSPPLPDVLFLRPKNEESQSVETSDQRPVDPDVVFAKSRPAVRESQSIPTPHTRFTSAGSLPIKDRPAAVDDPSSVEMVPEGDGQQRPILPEAKVRETPSTTTPTVKPPALEQKLPVHQPSRQLAIEPNWLVEDFQWNPMVGKLAELNQSALNRLAGEIFRSPANEQSGTNILAVSGLGRHVGTTTISQLAIQWRRQLSQLDPTLPFQEKPLPSLLVDASLWSPALARQIGLRCRRCWADIPQEFAALGEAVIADSNNQLHIMPLNCVVQSQDLDAASPGLGSSSYSIPAIGLPGLVKRLTNLIAAVQEQYQQIILDLGDIDSWVSYRAIDLLGPAISNLLIVHQPPINRRQFSHTYWSLHDLGIKNIHVLENAPIGKATEH